MTAEALALLDELNQTGRIAYGDYSALHDAISALIPAPPTEDDWYCGKCRGSAYEHSLESSACVWEPVAVTRPEPPRPQDITEREVQAFKEAWHKADAEGDSGNRVRRGLEAARDAQ